MRFSPLLAKIETLQLWRLKFLQIRKLGRLEILKTGTGLKGERLIGEMILVLRNSIKSPKIWHGLLSSGESVHDVGGHLDDGKLSFQKMAKNDLNGMIKEK